MLRKSFVLVFIRFQVKARYAAQFVGVGFHSFPGEGAAPWQSAIKRIFRQTMTAFVICNLFVICIL
jgi:hypothetical protein